MNRLCSSLDPGPIKSGVVEFEWPAEPVLDWPFGVRPLSAVEMENNELLDKLAATDYSRVCIEAMRFIRKKSGRTITDTIRWEGRFQQVANGRIGPPSVHLVSRSAARGAVGASQGGDPACRRGIIELYGGEAVAVGGKKCPTCKGNGSIPITRMICPDCLGDGCMGDGVKTTPRGVLYGWKGSHGFAALAVALAWAKGAKS